MNTTMFLARTIALITAASPPLAEALQADVAVLEEELKQLHSLRADGENSINDRITDLWDAHESRIKALEVSPPAPHGSEGTPPETIEVPLIPGYSWELVSIDAPTDAGELARVTETTRLPQPAPGQTYRLIIAPFVGDTPSEPSEGEPTPAHVGPVVA